MRHPNEYAGLCRVVHFHRYARTRARTNRGTGQPCITLHTPAFAPGRARRRAGTGLRDVENDPMRIAPPAQVRAETELAAAAVAGQLAHVARQRGGVMTGTAAELHKLGSGKLWPASPLELHHVVLPALARRASHAGCTVRPVGGMARDTWHVAALPLPQAAPGPQPRPVVPAPAQAAQARPVAAAPAVVSPAEYERVRSLAAAERNRQHWAAHDRAVAEKRAKEHAENLAFLAAAKGRAAA